MSLLFKLMFSFFFLQVTILKKAWSSPMCLQKKLLHFKTCILNLDFKVFIIIQNAYILDFSRPPRTDTMNPYAVSLLITFNLSV